MSANLLHRRCQCDPRRLRSSRGFSLLEVILALGILTGSVVMLGELARLGVRNAEAARALTEAELLCESKLAELCTGEVTPEAVEGGLLETDNGDLPWEYAVQIENVDEGLLRVVVTVRQQVLTASKPIECSLARLMLDTTNMSTTTDNSTSNSTDSSSSSSSTTTSSGSPP